MRVGDGHLSIEAQGLRTGQRVRVQLLARELIVAIEPPRGLSVRNTLRGLVRSIEADDAHTRMLEVDIGGASLIVRVTAAASTELSLSVGRAVRVLVRPFRCAGGYQSQDG